MEDSGRYIGLFKILFGLRLFIIANSLYNAARIARIYQMKVSSADTLAETQLGSSNVLDSSSPSEVFSSFSSNSYMLLNSVEIQGAMRTTGRTSLIM